MDDKIRVSMGTLRVLGMELLETGADPTTAYLQTYYPGRCRANCAFCAQARDSQASEENIARGLYVPRDRGAVFDRLKVAYEHGLLRRACIQTMNYEGMEKDLRELVSVLGERSKIPVSVSVYPVDRDVLLEMRGLGIDRVVIPLDASTPELFDAIKGAGAGGPYTWEGHMRSLREAVEVMGAGNVGTHIIIGLGETEEEVVRLIQELRDMGVYASLFAYSPTRCPRIDRNAPPIGHYRRIQLAAYLIDKGLSRADRMDYINEKIVGFGLKRGQKRDLDLVILSGEPFMTRGCPDCNRPYSTERPGGTMYNYPFKPSPADVESIRKELMKDYNVF